jgi:hypothetical protein
MLLHERDFDCMSYNRSSESTTTYWKPVLLNNDIVLYIFQKVAEIIVGHN